MSRSSRTRVLAVAVQAAILVSLFGGPAAIAAEPADPAATEVVQVAPEPSVEPTTEPVAEPTAEPPEGSTEAPPTEAPPAEVPTPDLEVAPSPAGTPERAPGVAEAEVAGSIATSTALVVEPAEVEPGAAVTLKATISPAPDPLCGSVTFGYNGATTDIAVDASGQAQTTVTAIAGSAPATASFPGCGEFLPSEDQAIVVARTASTTWLEIDTTPAVRYEESVTLTAAVVGNTSATGLITFRKVVGAVETTLGTAALDGGVASLTSQSFPVGTYDVVARFPGDPFLRPSASDPVALTILADTSVKVSGVGVQYARFYPMKDGYKDTDQVRGTTLEPATVTIRIYHSNGSRVKSWVLGTRDGSYAVTWTGRRTDGSVLPAGTYKVKQYFKDAAGNTATIVKDVYLSAKKLYWYTRSQTRYADTGVFYASGSAGAYRSSRFSHGALLDGGWYDDEAVLARYAFSLPSATIYKSLRVSIYGKSISPYGQGGMMFYNYAGGGYDGERLLGYSTNWYSSSVSASGHVSGGKVRAYVWAVGSNYGLVDYQKVKLTYKYAVLK